MSRPKFPSNQTHYDQSTAAFGMFGVAAGLHRSSVIQLITALANKKLQWPPNESCGVGYPLPQTETFREFLGEWARKLTEGSGSIDHAGTIRCHIVALAFSLCFLSAAECSDLAGEAIETLLVLQQLESHTPTATDPGAPAESTETSDAREPVHTTECCGFLDPSGKNTGFFYIFMFSFIPKQDCNWLTKLFISLAEQDHCDEELKPGWWPVYVPYKEKTDSLPKGAQIVLLVHILHIDGMAVKLEQFLKRVNTTLHVSELLNVILHVRKQEEESIKLDVDAPINYRLEVSAGHHKPRSNAHGSFVDESLAGYSDSDGGHGSLNSSGKVRSEQFARSEISLRALFKKAGSPSLRALNCRSSYRPKFLPRHQQLPLHDDLPAKKVNHPYFRSVQRLFTKRDPLPFPPSYGYDENSYESGWAKSCANQVRRLFRRQREENSFDLVGTDNACGSPQTQRQSF